MRRAGPTPGVSALLLAAQPELLLPNPWQTLQAVRRFVSRFEREVRRVEAP